MKFQFGNCCPGKWNKWDRKGLRESLWRKYFELLMLQGGKKTLYMKKKKEEGKKKEEEKKETPLSEIYTWKFLGCFDLVYLLSLFFS